MISIEDFSKNESAFSIKVERDLAATPKFIEGTKYLNFLIRVFLEIDVSKSNRDIYGFNDINFVKYQLHPSYKESSIISKDWMHSFEIKIWAYGYYSMQAIVYPKFGTSFIIDGFVRFPIYNKDKVLYDLENIKDKS